MSREITVDEIYERLKVLKTELETIQEESFDYKKGFRRFKNSLLDILDDLDYLKERDELLDDDWLENIGKKKEDIVEKKEEKVQDNSRIDLNDLMG